MTNEIRMLSPLVIGHWSLVIGHWSLVIRFRRHLKPRPRLLDHLVLGRLAEALAEDRGVVPTEAQLRIGGEASQRAEGFGPVGVVEQKNVTLFTLNQRQHVDVLSHAKS